MKLKRDRCTRGTRGSATGTGGFSNTKHLIRSINYLNEAKKAHAKADIGNACCIGYKYINDALLFLVSKQMIRKFHFTLFEAHARGFNTYKSNGATLYESNGGFAAQEIIDGV